MTEAAPRAFFDSDVVVYALTEQDGAKRAQALSLIERHATTGTLVLSTQVLVESFNVLTRKRGIAGPDAVDSLRVLATYEVIVPSVQTALSALELSTAHGLSPWDALIVQAALQGGCVQLYSEDLQPGRVFGALTVVNPFTAFAPPGRGPAHAPKARKR